MHTDSWILLLIEKEEEVKFEESGNYIHLYFRSSTLQLEYLYTCSDSLADVRIFLDSALTSILKLATWNIAIEAL